MKQDRPQWINPILANARHSLEKHHLPRIERCLNMMSEEEIWWRPHPSSNSVGNLVLHLNGNVRQWIVSGLGERPFRRERDMEFSEPGPVSHRRLAAMLRTTILTACRIICTLTAGNLQRQHTIQGFRVTGLQALLHVVEHFAFHSGQIIYITKLQRRKDLAFTRLPGDNLKRSHLPAL